MASIAYGLEQPRNPLAGIGEALRKKMQWLLGRTAVQREAQVDRAIQRAYGYANEWSVDPYHNQYEPQEAQPQPYMVAGENGQRRYENREEQAARMQEFHMRYGQYQPDVLETHSYEYTGVLPPRIAARLAYDNANPYNPGAKNPYDLQQVQSHNAYGNQMTPVQEQAAHQTPQLDGSQAWRGDQGLFDGYQQPNVPPPVLTGQRH